MRMLISIVKANINVEQTRRLASYKIRRPLPGTWDQRRKEQITEIREILKTLHTLPRKNASSLPSMLDFSSVFKLLQLYVHTYCNLSLTRCYFIQFFASTLYTNNVLSESLWRRFQQFIWYILKYMWFSGSLAMKIIKKWSWLQLTELRPLSVWYRQQQIIRWLDVQLFGNFD